jgi:uncharacterized protein YcbK (DUF882 family)
LIEGSHRSSRRQFLSFAAGAAATTLLPLPAFALAGSRKRSLAFHNLHTGEDLSVTYFADGRYRTDALQQIAVNLRDFRTGDVCAIDPKLLDLLCDLRRRMDCAAPFHVISGYRSPRTNQALAAKSNGVARKSLHMQGLAIDIRLPERNLAELRRVAMAMKGGGVGYYPKPGFVHLDVGRVRYW